MSEASLYDRIGGGDKLKAVVDDIWTNHTNSETVSARYKNSNPDNVKKLVWEFFCSGIGGSQTYTGRDMRETHTAMNINGDEFIAVCDDVLNALKKNDVGQKECDEVLCILYSMKDDIVHI